MELRAGSEGGREVIGRATMPYGQTLWKAVSLSFSLPASLLRDFSTITPSPPPPPHLATSPSRSPQEGSPCPGTLKGNISVALSHVPVCVCELHFQAPPPATIPKKVEVRFWTGGRLPFLPGILEAYLLAWLDWSLGGRRALGYRLKRSVTGDCTVPFQSPQTSAFRSVRPSRSLGCIDPSELEMVTAVQAPARRCARRLRS